LTAGSVPSSQRDSSHTADTACERGFIPSNTELGNLLFSSLVSHTETIRVNFSLNSFYIERHLSIVVVIDGLDFKTAEEGII